MTPDQMAAAITTGIKTDVPDHLNKSSELQRFLYSIGGDTKPELLDTADFRKAPGTALYRTVDQVYNRDADLNYTAPQIAAQVQAGRVTRVSSGGRAVYGEGIYFAGTTRGSSGYGGSSGNIDKTCMMYAKLKPGAKVIDYYSAQSGAASEINRGTRLGRALSRCNTRSRVSIYALAKGYDVIHAAGPGYYNVLNRMALTVSKDITSI